MNQYEVVNVVNQLGIQEKATIRKCEFTDLQAIMSLQQHVLNHLENLDLCSFVAEDEFATYVQDEGFILGTFINNRLVGFYAWIFPLKEENLGIDIGLAEHELQKVVHMEIAHVHPHYQGNNLQKIMVDQLLNIFKSQYNNSFQYLLGTVSPENIASLRHFFYAGTVIKEIKNKYNDVLRYICYRNLKSELRLNHSSVTKIDLTDIQKQKNLLKQGYVGFQHKRVGNENYILFCKVES